MYLDGTGIKPKAYWVPGSEYSVAKTFSAKRTPGKKCTNLCISLKYSLNKSQVYKSQNQLQQQATIYEADHK